MADAAPSRDPATRAALRASVVLMMLISVSAQASARGIGDVSQSARVALQARLIAERLLPVQTEAGLASGIRFESPDATPVAGAVRAEGVECRLATRAAPRMLRAELLNLPPPAC
jgi:hypothetical protein